MIDMMIVTDHKSFTEKYGDAAAAGLVMIKTKAGDGTGYEITKREIQAKAYEDYYGYDNKGNPIYSIEVKGLQEYTDVNYITYFMKTDEAVERYGDEVMGRYEQGAVAKTESAGTAIASPEKPSEPATAKPEKHKNSVIVRSILIAKEPREFKLSGDIDSDGMMIIKTKDRRGVTVSLGRGGSTDTIEETKRSGDSLVYDVKNKLAHIYSDGHLVHVYRDDAAESLRDLMRQYFPGYVKEESKVGQTVEYYEKDVVVVNSSLEDDMERVGSASKVLNISTGKEGDTINYVVYELTPDESAKPDKPAKPEKPAESDTDAPFIIAEVMPAFRGSGIAEFRNWVAENVEYPADAGEGTVVVFFVIEKDGSLSGIKTLASPNSKLSDAVVKVLKTSPKWTPGMNEGEAVRVQFNMTVSFQAPTPEV